MEKSWLSLLQIYQKESEDEAIEEIHSYNLSNVIPSWPLDLFSQNLAPSFSLIHKPKISFLPVKSMPNATYTGKYPGSATIEQFNDH